VKLDEHQRLKNPGSRWGGPGERHKSDRSARLGAPLRRMGASAKTMIAAYRRKPGAYRDAIAIIASALLVFAVSAAFDLFNKVISWIYRHDTWQLDEVFTVAVYLVLAISYYAIRRYRELVEQTRLRWHAQRETERLIPELENARADIHKLSILLPICPSCKKVRSHSGYWEDMESYVESHLNTRLDHGLCPECARQNITNGSDSTHPAHR
jgi:hypothetical protein